MVLLLVVVLLVFGLLMYFARGPLLKPRTERWNGSAKDPGIESGQAIRPFQLKTPEISLESRKSQLRCSHTGSLFPFFRFPISQTPKIELVSIFVLGNGKTEMGDPVCVSQHVRIVFDFDLGRLGN